MPRGRHRHSPPLHKLLPPSAVAGGAILCAAGAWLFADPVVLRGLIAATAAVAVTGAAFMRHWDRDAGRRVADLTRGRESDRWQSEERVAELEADIEESREMRLKLDAKLRSKRVELAGLRGEHAALLRRYATAETERASALEGRRQLALGAAVEPRALPAGDAPTDTAYARAARALENLTRNAAAQQVRRTVEAARERDMAERAAETEEPHGRHAANSAAATAAATTAATGVQHARPSSALPATRVRAASAIVPYAPQRRPVRRPGAGFDFFGTQATGGTHHAAAEVEGAEATADKGDKDEPAPAAHLAKVAREDLADVVGEEALAAQRATETEGREAGQVIDLTAHDETEQLELGELRSAISS
jgi:hypothetical protein